MRVGSERLDLPRIAMATVVTVGLSLGFAVAFLRHAQSTPDVGPTSATLDEAFSLLSGAALGLALGGAFAALSVRRGHPVISGLIVGLLAYVVVLIPVFVSTDDVSLEEDLGLGGLDLPRVPGSSARRFGSRRRNRRRLDCTSTAPGRVNPCASYSQLYWSPHWRRGATTAAGSTAGATSSAPSVRRGSNCSRRIGPPFSTRKRCSCWSIVKRTIPRSARIGEPVFVLIYDDEKGATDADRALRSHATSETFDVRKGNVVVGSDERVTAPMRKRIRAALAVLASR